MADNIMDAFLLYVGSDDEIREELDRRIMSWKGEKREITKHVLIPFAAEHGYIMTEEDVEETFSEFARRTRKFGA